MYGADLLKLDKVANHHKRKQLAITEHLTKDAPHFFILKVHLAP